MIDYDPHRLPEGTIFKFGLQPPPSDKRKYYWCGKRHMNGGNTCRYEATKLARGEYIYYIDDDDYLADDRVLEFFNQVTADWALFGMLVCGSYFFYNPPGMCRVTTGQFLIKRGLVEWPDVNNYETDGMLIEELMQKQIPYQVFKDRIIAVHPAWNVGKYV